MGAVTVGGKTKVRKATIRAVVLNADGTVKKNLGVVAYTHRSLFKRLVYRVTGIALH